MRYIIILLAVFLLGHTERQPQSRQIQNLEAFAKLYGYIKYFHPSDEAAAIAPDWDKFAIYGADKVVGATTDAELVATLNRLFLPIAPSIKIYEKKNPQKFDISQITPPDAKNYKEVNWQHFGVGLNEKSTYKSVRLNRPEPTVKNDAGFAPFFQVISGKELQGKEFRLKGLMKVDARESGSGHLWLRVDKENNTTGFFNNMGLAPATLNEWKEYGFPGKIDDDAKNVSIGGFIQGSGAVGFDDIVLQVKNKDTWETYPMKNTSFDDKLNGWFYKEASGYKYEVKSDATKNYFEIASQNAAASTNMAQPLFDQKLKMGASIQKDLSGTIAAIVPLVLYGNDEHTYPAGNAMALNKLKAEIKSFYEKNNTGDKLALRLGNVVTAWNVFRHFFSYWDNASKTPEQILKAALEKSYNDKTAVDFRYTLLAMTEPLNDGHIGIGLAGDPTPAFFPAFSVGLVEKNIVVDKVFDDAAKVKPGDIIEKIDGKDALAILKEKKSYISGSQQWKTFKALRYDILRGVEGAMLLNVNRNGQKMEIKDSRDKTSNYYYNSMMAPLKNSGAIKDGIYYLDMSKITADTINAWKDDLSKAKAIICDLRGYPNGANNLISHLLTKEEDTKWMFVPEILYPDYEKVTYKGMGWNMQPLKPHFPGRVIFITDGRAISYAESYMGFIKDFKLATIIGQPTAGTNGNINPFTLPGRYSISWTGMLVKNHDGSRHHLNGIVPDIYLERTIKGIIEERDEFLEKSLALAEK